MSILSLNTADIFNAIGGGSPLSVVNSTLHPSYSIRSRDGTTALEFDGMMSIGPSGRASITTAPVEGGKYQAINKVRSPRQVRCSLVVSGLSGFNGSLPDILSLSTASQSSVLSVLKTMIETANVYDIDTPKENLTGYDLVAHSYEVNSQKGVSLLTVYLDFQEVIEQMEVQLSGAQSASKATTNDTAAGVTGMASVTKQANSKSSSLDELSKSWSNLKKATGQLTTTVVDGVTTSFSSAANTVKESAADVAKSAVDKTTDIVSKITGSIT